MELNRKRDTEGPLRQGSFSAEGQGLEAYRESLSRRDFQIFMVKSHEDAFFPNSLTNFSCGGRGK